MQRFSPSNTRDLPEDILVMLNSLDFSRFPLKECHDNSKELQRILGDIGISVTLFSGYIKVAWVEEEIEHSWTMYGESVLDPTLLRLLIEAPSHFEGEGILSEKIHQVKDGDMPNSEKYILGKVPSSLLYKGIENDAFENIYQTE